MHETVLAEPVIDMARERSAPAPRGRRIFRSFFPPRNERPAETVTGTGDEEPKRLQEFLQRVIVYFEQLSVRLYEGSVAEQRRRRSRLTPRVHIRPPARPGEAEMLRRRRRRQFAARLATPFAIIAVIAAIGWAGTTYRTEITAKVEELTSGAGTIGEVPAAVAAKDDDVEAVASLPQPDLVLFDGRDPSVFRAGPAKPVESGSDAAGGYVRIQAPAADEDGARLVISPGVADRLARRTIHVVVTARSPTDDGAGTIRLGYRAGDEASPFSAQPLGREYRRLEIVWTVPGGSALGEHALLIEPGLLGGGSVVDVKAVEVYFGPEP
jgi:hypothetical protein